MQLGEGGMALTVDVVRGNPDARTRGEFAMAETTWGMAGMAGKPAAAVRLLEPFRLQWMEVEGHLFPVPVPV